jgi:type VI secretion system protein ImpL
VLTWKDQGKAENRLIVRSLVTALLISSVVYGERRLESVFDWGVWWLPPLGMAVMLSAILWWVMRLGQQPPGVMQPPSEGQQSPRPASRSSFHLLQSKMDEVIQTLEGTAKGRQRRNALHTQPWYLLIGAGASGKTGLLEGLARLVPPMARPSAPRVHPTSDCNWWVFPTAAILDTCGRYTSSRPRTPDHDEWCGVLEFLHTARARRPLNGILLTVAADALGMQPLECLRRDAVTVRQRLHEARRVLAMDIPLYILVTRCDLIDGFVEFVAHLPEYVRTQVFGWVHDAQPPRGQQTHSPGVTLPVAYRSAMLTRRLDQLRLFLLSEALRTGISRQQLFCFPDEFRALQRRLYLFLEVLCDLEVPLDLPFVRGLFFCSAQQRGMPFSALRDNLGFKTPVQPLEESTVPYFLHDLLTVILPRDRHLTRRATRL